MEKNIKQSPRTRHLEKNGTPLFTNKLSKETSPYLLQHANNPVNWLPWGEEAFNLARTKNLPVFLSVGYSTCHWCHVMEEESFEDLEIAEFLNNHFISVKVDREERPDVDSLYMKAVQAISGGGGWPMSVFLTPDKIPFYGGTYFPARDGDRGVIAGFLTVLQRISNVFKNDRGKIDTTESQMMNILKTMAVPEKGEKLPGVPELDGAVQRFKQEFDWENGGMKGAMKFPSSLPVRFLLGQYQRTGREDLLKIVELTLKKMNEGGIHDQVGGGFHRYATDKIWLVPHYEKMLYDNALLALTYTEAFHATSKPEYETTIRMTMDYLVGEMLAPGGGFYSATDADSLTPEGEKEEGYFFTWTMDEVNQVLTKEEAGVLKHYFSMKEGDDRQILHITESIKDAAHNLNLEISEFKTLLYSAKKKLYKERTRRSPPGLDDKIIASWNGMAISALIKAGSVLKEPSYKTKAIETAQFLFEHLFDGRRLFRSFKNGRRGPEGFLSDYASVTAAFLDIFETTKETLWLERAVILDKILEDNFEDMENGGFFMTPMDKKDLIVREKPGYDGATPSGNSMAAMNLLRLHNFTGNNYYVQRGEKLLCFFSKIISKAPESLSEMLIAVNHHLRKKI